MRKSLLATFATVIFISSANNCISATDTVLEHASPGQARFVVRTDPSWDAFTGTPNAAMKSWFNTHVWRMMVYSPFFDERLSWYPKAWIYINLYSIPVNSLITREHPDWVLRDSAGRPLYIPYECRGGSCPQYAGDITNAAYRKAWLEKAARFKQAGYHGFWVDDVNMAFRVSDGQGKFVAPVRNGQEMTENEWQTGVVNFVEEIRRTFPKVEILHNSIWFAGGEARDRSPLIKRQIAAADYINVERGVTDGGLKGDDGEWSINALFGFIDRVHAAGRGIVLDNTGDDYMYGLAGFYMISSGVDAVGAHGLRPGNWPTSLSTDLGTPLGERKKWNGLLIRRFSNGIAIVNPPSGQTVHLSIPESLSVADSQGKSGGVDIPSPGGIVLTGSISANGSLDQLLHVQ